MEKLQSGTFDLSSVLPLEDGLALTSMCLTMEVGVIFLLPQSHIFSITVDLAQSVSMNK